MLMTCGCKNRTLYLTAVMQNSGETPAVPFMMLRDHFLVPPEIEVYDNACHLATYCYSREPGYFWGVKFLIHRFHISNHTTCSWLYNCDSYRDEGIREINSQGCKQTNRKFQKIETSLMLMISLTR